MNSSSNSLITLNVGGVLYTTTTSTLCSPACGDTFFTSLLSGRFPKTTRDKDGNYFIDRNGKTFEYILDYLRSGKWRFPGKLKAAVREEAAFYGVPFPYPHISDDICDELLVRSSELPDPSGELIALRNTIMGLWEKRAVEGNRKIACLVLDAVQHQNYRYFSSGAWAVLDDFQSEEARVGIPYLELPKAVILLQHEWAREKFRADCKADNDLTVTVSEVRAYNKTDKSLNPIWKIVGFKIAWIRSPV